MASIPTALLERCGPAAAHAAGLFAVSGLIVLALIAVYPGQARVLIVLAVLDLLSAAIICACPWRSWPEHRTVLLAWPAFALLGLSTWAVDESAALTGPFFVLLFAWLGLHHRPRHIWWCVPPAAVAYAAPLVVSGADPGAIGSTFTLIPISVCVALLIAAHVKGLAEARQQMAHQARHEAMTGLPNRAQCMHLLHAALSRGRRDSELVAVLYLDLDGFKGVNDTLGHQAGDAVLRVVAERLNREIRAGDTAGRLGGDEFLVVLETVASEDLALEVGVRIIDAISEPIAVAKGQVVRIGASVGIRFNVDGSVDADAALHDADIALYRAKNRGRGQVVVFETTPTAGRAGGRKAQ